MSQISALPERLINSPHGATYEVHRASVGIAERSGINIGFAAYRDGTVVPSLSGDLIVYVGSSPIVHFGQILGPAALLITEHLPAMSVIMVCLDDDGIIRGASIVEHRNYMSRWCFF